MIIGSHVSIRGGYLKAAKAALTIGADAFQFFPKNPKGLSIKAFNAKDADACRQFCHEHQLVSVAHTPYPTNLALPETSRQSIVASLINDLTIAEACGAIGVVVHFGHYREKNTLQGYQNIIQCINEILDQWMGNAKLILENQAGEGTDMGMTIHELCQIRLLSNHREKIGFCLDTCHAFASGMWNITETDVFMRLGDELGYWSNLLVVHLNDSHYEAGSRRDRHEQIGLGRIGKQALRDLLVKPPFREIPLLLETSTGEDGSHREEISIVRDLLKGKNY